MVQGDMHTDKARDFIEKGSLGEEQEGKGAQEGFPATWLAVSGVTVMGLVSRLFLANSSDLGPSWWHMHCSAKMDAGEKDSGRW